MYDAYPLWYTLEGLIYISIAYERRRPSTKAVDHLAVIFGCNLKDVEFLIFSPTVQGSNANAVRSSTLATGDAVIYENPGRSVV